MAWAIRVDDVTRIGTPPDDRVDFKVTFGPTPLPAGWQGFGFCYGSTVQTQAAFGPPTLEEQQTMAESLLLILFKAVMVQFPNITGAQFRNAVVGAVITVDAAATTRSGVITIT